MGFGPNEPGVDQFHFAQRFQLAQAQSQQFFGLESAVYPLERRLEVSFAIPTELQRPLFGYVLRYVDVNAETRHAHVGRIRVHEHAALATQSEKTAGRGALKRSGPQTRRGKRDVRGKRTLGVDRTERYLHFGYGGRHRGRCVFHFGSFVHFERTTGSRDERTETSDVQLSKIFVRNNQ